MNSNEDFLDIMPNVNIEINYIFYLFLFSTTILAILLLFIVLKKFKYKKKHLSKNEVILEKLKNLSFEEDFTKELLYKFTFLIKELKNNKIDDKLRLILEEIEPFKYKKEEKISNNKLKKLLKEYINEL